MEHAELCARLEDILGVTTASVEGMGGGCKAIVVHFTDTRDPAGEPDRQLLATRAFQDGGNPADVWDTDPTLPESSRGPWFVGYYDRATYQNGGEALDQWAPVDDDGLAAIVTTLATPGADRITFEGDYVLVWAAPDASDPWLVLNVADLYESCLTRKRERDADRTAHAAGVIHDAMIEVGYYPSGLAESGNTPEGWNLVVEIDGHDYSVEVCATVLHDRD